MSRGFVKEDDQEETPLVPPRADLPEGVINYVTPLGMEALQAERENLLSGREQLSPNNGKEERISFNYITAKLQLLTNRLATAKIIDLRSPPQDEVRFGAQVTLKIGKAPQLQKYQIVGVDEADISQQKIAFISPMASLLIGKKVGEEAVLQLAKEDRVFKIVKIEY